MPQDVLVIGGGMSGLILALGLVRAGHKATVFERADFDNALPGQFKFGELGGGVAISTNGSQVLQDFGLWEEVQRKGGPLFNTRFCRIDGTLIAEVDVGEKANRESVFVLRSALHEIMTTSALKGGVKLFVCKQLVGIDQTEGRVTAHFKDGTSATGSVLIGADGIHSQTRALIFEQAKTGDYPIFTGSQGHVGVSSLSPDDPLLKQVKAGLSFFTDSSNQNTVELMFTSPSRLSWRVSDYSQEGKEVESWAPATNLPKEVDRLAELVKSWGVPSYVTDVMRHAIRISPVSIYDRKSLKTWTVGNVTLIGDSAHGMPPHLGQGTNQALEDVAVLSELFQRFPDDASTCFKIYEALRIKRTTQFAENTRKMGAAQYTKTPIMRAIGELGIKGFVFAINRLGLNFEWDWRRELDKELKKAGKA
ncbi:hypothetical protein BC830DRAFT_1135391 [Chytriomyces sp. MP71]|nr:hypothetical protein BC830DRAFT_1135391 [Chytriomyces sp. MP71]